MNHEKVERISIEVVYLPFHYYSMPGARPVLCELDSDGYVYMSHVDQVLHRDKWGGRFVPLVELHDGS